MVGRKSVVDLIDEESLWRKVGCIRAEAPIE